MMMSEVKEWTGDIYQELAARTMPNPEDKIASGVHGVLGLICEKREYLEAVSDLGQSIPCDDDVFQTLKTHVQKEIGDMWWFVAEIATANDLSLSQILEMREFYPTLLDPYVAIAEIYQKHYQGHEIDGERVSQLLSYITDSLSAVSRRYGGSVESIWKQNIEKLVKRYPDGFEAEKSLYRAEGDV